MKSVEFIFLSQEDVAGIGLTMAEAIRTVEGVFREHALKHVENPPKPGVHPQSNAFIHAMPGYLADQKAVGLKWVSSFPSNNQRGLPAVMGVLVLNDVDTGQPLALMDCRWITAVRTGAVAGVSAKYLARKDSQVVGIVGAGIQGRYNLLALKEVLPSLQLARVFDINSETQSDYIEKMGKVLPFQVEGCGSPQQVIEGADVIVTATGKLNEPIYKEKWVQPGALVLPVHHRGWENELLHRAEKFVADDWRQLKQAHAEVGGFYGDLPALYAELGEIVIGDKPGRENDRERIVDFNYGLAIEDIAMAKAVYTRAIEKGIGKALTLMEDELTIA